MGNSTGGGPSPGTADAQPQTAAPAPATAPKAKHARDVDGSGRPPLSAVAAERVSSRVTRVRNTDPHTKE